MSGLLPDVDPEGLLEYSVVFTDRALNHMSQKFQGVMRDISRILKHVYNADAVAVVPGGGTFGMEAVARQFANDERCLVIRNGWFSFRWSQILEMGKISDDVVVMQASQIEDSVQAPFAPAPIEAVVAAIKEHKPSMVFAPHVETASGMILPDSYLKAVAEAAAEVGALFVLDCIASGTLWVDMKEVGVDVLLSAPQKGWSSSPCAAQVMLSDKALARMSETTSSSFACDLNKWLDIMRAYENGGHAYHATMPTDALAQFRDTMLETEAYGFEKVKTEQQQLGDSVRAMLESKGVKSVAAEGFKAPGVVVSYTLDDAMHNGSKFLQAGLQTAAGVPLQCGERDDFKTFRIGLFGLEKLHDPNQTVANLSKALDKVLAE